MKRVVACLLIAVTASGKEARERELVNHGKEWVASQRRLSDRRFDALRRHSALHSAFHESHVGMQTIDTLLPSPAPVNDTCHWTSIGPTNISGRVTGMAIDPREPRRILITTIGGVWRSEDAGGNWRRVSDPPDRPLPSPAANAPPTGVFSAVAFHPQRAGRVVIANGDPQWNVPGTGVWQADDFGRSWKPLGGPEIAGKVIFRLRFDPQRPDDLYAATSRGVFRLTGGAAQWVPLGGAQFDAVVTDLVLDFTHGATVVWAAVGGRDKEVSTRWPNGVYRFDGTWKPAGPPQLGNASSSVLALAISPRSRNLYVKAAAQAGGTLLGVYRSSLDTIKWSALPLSTELTQDSLFGAGSGYSWYNSVIEADPVRADVVYVGGVGLFRGDATQPASTSWVNLSSWAGVGDHVAAHPDHHAIAFSAGQIFLGTDGGVYAADLAASPLTWRNISHGVITAEFYHVTAQRGSTPIVAGGLQDNGLIVTFGNRSWYSGYGGDGIDVAIDAANRDTLYGTVLEGDEHFLFRIPDPVPSDDRFAQALGWSLFERDVLEAPLHADANRGGALLAVGRSCAGNVCARDLRRTLDGVSWDSLGSFGTEQTPTVLAADPRSGFDVVYAATGPAPYVPVTVTPGLWRRHGDKWDDALGTAPHDLPLAGAAAVLSLFVDHADAGKPERVFAIVGSPSDGVGKIYVSVDSAKSWSALEQSVPANDPKHIDDGLMHALLSDSRDPDLLYAASMSGMYRGRVSGGSRVIWETFDDGLPAGVEVRDLWASGHEILIGTRGYGAYSCVLSAEPPARTPKLLIRDNVFDRGDGPSANGEPDPEHPICDLNHCAPATGKDATVYWWSSTDIRVMASPPPLTPDSVDFEACPIDTLEPENDRRNCGEGTVRDGNPVPGTTVTLLVQVQNRGIDVAKGARARILWTESCEKAVPPLADAFWSDVCGALPPGAWKDTSANGCTSVGDVESAWPRVARVDWAVPPAQPPPAWCFLAVVDSADDPVARHTGEKIEDVIRKDRHVALRSRAFVTSPEDAFFSASIAKTAKPGVRHGGILRNKVSKSSGGKVIGGRSYFLRR